MRDRFQHATHIVRVAAVFALGILAFLIVRWAVIPADFGTLGFYRAGAIDDARTRPIAYAGTPSCVECHVGKYESEYADPAAPPADLVKDNRHSVLRCEACHGPLAFHAIDQTQKEQAKKAGREEGEGSGRPVPLVESDKLCLGCHLQLPGRPERHPQVLVGDHGGNDKCQSCHRPHRPRTDEDEG